MRFRGLFHFVLHFSGIIRAFFLHYLDDRINPTEIPFASPRTRALIPETIETATADLFDNRLSYIEHARARVCVHFRKTYFGILVSLVIRYNGVCSVLTRRQFIAITIDR